ncbi:hypothetical protein [Bradyrhizobium sp. Ghvi]|uniref:hypothetical protein n=1 Tax=Bradyrhizobium sp. Ghvi TaxID=1855319 RepID=UPI001177B03C|nr:hypothetical protein [Bradyrhizobium sp. Ghvi]
MQPKSPDKDRKQRRGHRQHEVLGGQEDMDDGSASRRAEGVEGGSAHEVHEGKLVKKPATESGK